MFGSKPSTEPAWFMSRALPWGKFGMMSTRTTSAYSRRASSSAQVAPTLPAPTTVTFLRNGDSQLVDDRVGDLARPDRRRVVAGRFHVVGEAAALADHVCDRRLQPVGRLA